MDLHSIELFSGVGMLGEGLRAGLRHLGFEACTRVHVEREAYAASVLAARMVEGSMDEALVWPDVCTFDASAWRGRVDCVIAGFPCQDLSIAGRRAGLDGKRSGLFFEVVRIATDSGAWLMFLENVAGIATATASVVDAEEGELDERAASRVVGELADLGWDSEWITLSASDVGASHGRARWFCLAWRNVADATRNEWANNGRQGRSGRRVREAGNQLANSASSKRGELARPDQRGLQEPHGGSAEAAPMADTKCAKRRPISICGTGGLKGHDTGGRETHGGPGVADQVLEQPTRLGRQERRAEPAGQQGRPDASVDGGAVADSSTTGWRCAQGCDQPGQRCVEEQGLAGCGECGWDVERRPEVVGSVLADTGEQRQPLATVIRGGA